MFCYFATNTEPQAVQNLKLNATSFSAIRVIWNPPMCPYGNITKYQGYYIQRDEVQISSISGRGYTKFSVLAATGSDQTYLITRLIPYTNYAVHIQAVVHPLAGGNAIFGAIEVENLTRTLSAPDDVPLAPPTVEPTESPTKNQIVVRIGDPTIIDTGRVM